MFLPPPPPKKKNPLHDVHEYMLYDQKCCSVTNWKYSQFFMFVCLCYCCVSFLKAMASVLKQLKVYF